MRIRLVALPLAFLGLALSSHATPITSTAGIPSGPAHTTARVVPFGIPAVPEPSSFLLLGTGLVGVMGAARNRFRKV